MSIDDGDAIASTAAVRAAAVIAEVGAMAAAAVVLQEEAAAAVAVAVVAPAVVATFGDRTMFVRGAAGFPQLAPMQWQDSAPARPPGRSLASEIPGFPSFFYSFLFSAPTRAG